MTDRLSRGGWLVPVCSREVAIPRGTQLLIYFKHKREGVQHKV
jgi:hypothetical protein